MRRNAHAGRTRSGGFGLSVFTRDEIDDIHLATLEVLGGTGVFVEDDEALEIFASAGAKVDAASRVVKIPGYLVEEAIASAPSKLLLRGRNPKNDVVIEAGRVGFTTFGEGIKIVDPHTGKLREPTKQDVADTAKVADYLDEVDVYERAVGAHEVPQEVVPLHNAEAAFANTSKHIFMGPGDGFLLKKILEMAAAIVGGMERLKQAPIISFITCPVSPLKLVKETCDIIMESAKAGMTCNILSMAMAGGSSPVNLAGTLVTHNAEVLAGVTLSQLASKGAPIVYGSSTTAMDLRFASASVGSPECALINAGVACLARSYLLPSWVAGA
jgi:trimethylamine--corrinoid protein Co-methyltransferase